MRTLDWPGSIEAEEILKMRERVNRLIARETGQPLEKVNSDTERNYWMSAEQAKHYGIVAKIVAEYIARLDKSFSCWRNRLGFMDTFRISRADSGFPVFQNLLELENDRRQANQRLSSIPQADEIRNEMADFILRHKEFPAALQTQMAERLYRKVITGPFSFGSREVGRTFGVELGVTL